MQVNHSLPPILALHGSASSGQQWQHLKQVCGEHRQVFSPDLPGYQGQPGSTKVGLTERLNPLLADLLAVPGPMHVVGHSFGAAIAQRFAALHPEKCLSLTLYEPTAFHLLAHELTENDKAMFAQLESLGSNIKQAQPEQAMGLFIDFWMGEGRWKSLKTQSKQGLLTYSQMLHLDFADAIHNAYVPCDLPAYGGSTKVMYGEQTVMIAKRICQLLAQKLPQSQLLALPSLGHMGPIQSPERVNTEILDHIQMTESNSVSY